MTKPRVKSRLEYTCTFPDPGLPDTTYVVEVLEEGVRLRRKGKRGEKPLECSWRTIIGILLTHRR